ncbi:MAG: alpha/beta hydrolase [Nanoarchaeota archaeon]|nr:alpha/beta hydrolase [Nanoarchaeota archaeon]MBU1103562.1 alpha/beta hydrolase [Nanoarchaeota archaeon]
MLEKLVRGVLLSAAGCAAGCGFPLFSEPGCVSDVECGFMTNSYGVETQWEFYLGEGGQPLIIAVHGFDGSASDFRGFFQDKFNVLSYTQPGHAPSDSLPARHTIPATARVLDDVVNFARDSQFISGRADLERVYLVGFSMGGFTVCQYLNDYPENDLNAIIINSYDGFPSDAENFVYAAVVLESLFNPLKDTEPLLEYCQTMPDFDVSQTLPYLNSEISWIIGAKDVLFPVEDSQTLGERYGESNVYEINAGHWLLDNAQVVREIVENFD